MFKIRCERSPQLLSDISFRHKNLPSIKPISLKTKLVCKRQAICPELNPIKIGNKYYKHVR